MTTNKKH